MNVPFPMAILDLISCVHLACSICYDATETVEAIHIHWFFSIYHNLLWRWLLCDSQCLSSFPHPFQLHSTFQFQLAFQSCPLSPFLPQPVIQDHLRISWCKLFVLLSGSFQTLQQLPCLTTPLQIFTLFVSPYFIFTSALQPIHSSLINLLLLQLILVSFRICISLDQFT